MTIKISGDVVRQLRLLRGWSQDHLAHLIDRNVRTVQRVEASGICDLETRSALASVFKVELAQLDGDKKIEQAMSKVDDGLLYYWRVKSGRDIVDIFFDADGHQFSNEDARSAEDAEYVASFVQYVHDCSDIWNDIEPGYKVQQTFELGEKLRDLERKGFSLFGLRTKGKTSVKAGADTKQLEMEVGHFHIAYADSERIVVLDGKKRR